MNPIRVILYKDIVGISYDGQIIYINTPTKIDISSPVLCEVAKRLKCKTADIVEVLNYFHEIFGED